MKYLRMRMGLPLLALTAGLALTGCGHSEEEWQQAQRDIAKLKADLDTANKQDADDQQKNADAQKQIQDLQAQLKAAGVDLTTTKAQYSDLQTAMKEYEARLKQLDDMKARFKDLKARLDKLTAQGLKVVVRNNRMVIQLPGDILFDSGRDSLKPDGKKILKSVADVVNGDNTLRARNFQVAGHTDKEPYNGQYFDNWGLSVMRARQVLTFLVAPDKGVDAKGLPTGGGLDPTHWAAAGYGQMDPVAGTTDQQSPDQEQKNRRVELVLQPDISEMLDLKNLTGGT
jgi:chemotaxis protein MotB